jgi:hypothetical protein
VESTIGCNPWLDALNAILNSVTFPLILAMLLRLSRVQDTATLLNNRQERQEDRQDH